VKRTGRSSLTLVALVATGVALAGSNACSRTDDPLEHYASPGRAGSGSPSGGGQGDGPSPSQQAGKSNGDGGQGATAGKQGAGAADAGGAPEGGTDAGPPNPSDFDCGEAPISTEAFSKRALRSAAADCALYHYCRFEGGATELERDVADYVEAPSEQTLAAAQAAFAQAMSLWSVAEFFQFGPAGSKAVSQGKDIYQGRGLRELIHAWPLTTRCRVEEQVALQGYQEGMDESILVTGRGLFGLDYLLHYAGDDTSCMPSSAAGKEWATLSSEELTARKLDYAAALGSDVLTQIRELRAAWAEDGGNFRPLFVDATGYPEDELKVMTVTAWSLIYIEREVKDWKLGVPAGYTLSAPVTLPESPYSGLGTENLRANLRGFRALFQGCGPEGEGLGFDDWLIAQGHGDLATDIVAAWQNAQATADAFPPIAQASPAELEALYRAVKAVADLIKNDLFGDGSPLGLDLPEGVIGDTD
jgi:uncharacterized protein